MTRSILFIAAGITVGALIAKKQEPETPIDTVDLIIEKSNQTMKQAGEVSARADQQVAKSIGEMKQTIQVLEEEKEELVEQVKVMQDEIVAVKSAAVQPFDVLAIGVPDTANRK
jgi:uncharacterized protein YoxC